MILKNYVEAILVELKNEQFVYHLSPVSGIEIFIPRKFIHNKDYTSSGQYDEESGKIPRGYKLSSAIFAALFENAVAYCLPRNQKRIIAYINNSKKMYLESKDKNTIETHSFSIYKFFKKDFQYIDASDEFISNKSLKPISEVRKSNPVKFLLDNGYDVEFVDDLKKTLKTLKKAGINYDTEAI